MQCCICLQEPDNQVKQACCANIFCFECLQKWKSVKNTCPLCGTKLSNQQINQLKNRPQDNNFDNGFLMLEQQMKQIRIRMKYAEQRINTCRSSSKNLKTLISTSHIIFLDDQIQLMRQYTALMEEAWNNQDRASCVQYLQMLVELLYGVQSALDNGSIRSSSQMDEQQFQDYDIDCYEFGDDEEDDYAMYQQHQYAYMKKHAQKQKKISKANACIQQKGKSIKEI